MAIPWLAITAGAGIIKTIADMVGRQKAEDEAEKQRKKEEALQRAMWLSQRREQAFDERMR